MIVVYKHAAARMIVVYKHTAAELAGIQGRRVLGRVDQGREAGLAGLTQKMPEHKAPFFMLGRLGINL